MSETPTTDRWTLHCDGTACPNPGRMGIGAVLVGPTGERHTLSRALSERGCSNEAEAEALIAGLELARSLGAEYLQIFTDSVVLVEQTTGRDRTEVPRLMPRFEKARAHLRSFAHAELRWIRRTKNHEADVLARGALGLPPKVRTLT